MKRTMLVLTMATALAACDDSGGSNGTADGGQRDGGGTAGSTGKLDGGTTDGSNAGSGGTAGGAGGAAGSTTTKSGSVSVNSSAIMAAGMTFGSYTATAAFSTSTSSGTSGSNCTTKTVSGCTVIICQAVDAGVPPQNTTTDAGVAVAANVGKIDITGGADPVALTPDGTGTYPAVTGTKTLWTAATDLTFKAAGGTIPKFPDTVVPAPLAVTGIMLDNAAPPALGMKAAVTRTAGLKFTWTGGSGDLNIFLVQQGGGKTVSATCMVPATTATFTLAASILGEMSAGDGTLLLSQMASKSVMAGDYKVNLSAGTSPSPSLLQLDLK